MPDHISPRSLAAEKVATENIVNNMPAEYINTENKTLCSKLKSFIKDTGLVAATELVYASAALIGIVLTPFTVPYYIVAICKRNLVYSEPKEKNKNATICFKLKSFLKKTTKAAILIIFWPLYLFFPC